MLPFNNGGILLSLKKSSFNRINFSLANFIEFCVDSCVYLAVILAALIKGEGKEVLTRQWWDAKQIPLNKHVLEIIENDDNPVGSGFVIRSLHAALWSFRHANSFQDAVLTAVNLGDDADTTGAVCGQLAGAYWGFNGIPQSLIDGLDKKEMIDMYLNPILGDKND
jgi:ADP-ribosyl-[dinitrogen reductase] hydrolase